MSVCRIGMVGYNDGNGHPYSFSAIINGYNEAAFPSCPYPVINDYLKARKAEDFGIGACRVTHIWTPYPEISESIAHYASIEKITADYKDFIGHVDAVIIARDDAETHREIATPFLNAGIKVFVDKPLCKTEEDLEFFIPYLEKGQLMSCSGLRFYPGIVELESSASSVLFAHCVAPLDWFKYGIHAIEGAVPLFEGPVVAIQNIGERGNDIVRIEFENGKFMIVQVSGSLAGGIRSTVYMSDSAPRFIHFNDNFSCFKQQLLVFNSFVSENRITIQPEQTISLIRALIAADKSRIDQHKIYISYGR